MDTAAAAAAAGTLLKSKTEMDAVGALLMPMESMLQGVAFVEKDIQLKLKRNKAAAQLIAVLQMANGTCMV
eukprot:1162055-Pelagomonas_calceolata.AAC.4